MRVYGVILSIKLLAILLNWELNNMRITILNLLILTFVPAMVLSQNHPSKEEIYSVIKKEVDNGRSKSISVGVYDKGDVFFVSYGKPFENSEAEANKNTIYELASVTKIFVTTVFADLILKKMLNPGDSISKFLPDTLKFKDEKIKNITLQQLATHTSGITETLENHERKPYWKYLDNLTYSKLFAILENFELNENKINKYEYSNFNIALLAYVVCEIENEDLESVFNKYYYKPLDLQNTGLILSEKQKQELASSYIKPKVRTDYYGLENSSCMGAAGLKSSANDLVKLIEFMFFKESPLKDAVESSIIPRFDSTQFEDTKMGYGWFVSDRNGISIVGHGGSSRHISTNLTVDYLNQYGFVVLSNSGNSINDIAEFILNKNIEIKTYKSRRFLRK